MVKEDNLKFKNNIKSTANNTQQYNVPKREKMKTRIMDKYNVSATDAEKILDKIEQKKIKTSTKNKQIKDSSKIRSVVQKNKNAGENITLKQSSIQQDSKKNSMKEIIPKFNAKQTSKNETKTNVKTIFKKIKTKLDEKTDDGIPIEPTNIKTTLDEKTDDRITIEPTNIKTTLDEKTDDRITIEPTNSIASPKQITDKPNELENVNGNPTINDKTDSEIISELNENNDNIMTTYSTTETNNIDTLMTELLPDYKNEISIELTHVNLTFEVDVEKIDTIKERIIRTLEGNKSSKLKIHALKDINLKIYKGEKVGIIGYNGAGKSTLLRVISGIYTPNSGTVKTKGNISPLLSLGAGFDFNYTGRQNIILNGAVLGYSKEFLNEKMEDIIEFSELREYIDIPIKNYSSGMLSKLGFSIATSVEPDILIIDEILGVGDVTFQRKSGDKIRSLMDGETTVIFVSHSIPQVRNVCDKAVWIDNGEIKEIGEVNKVCDHYLKDAENASNEQLADIQFE